MIHKKHSSDKKIIEICIMHIGNIIEQVITSKELNVSKFAESVGMNRSNLYNVFKRKSIDTDLLFIFSKKLEYDFFGHYTKELHVNVSDLGEPEDKYEEKAYKPVKRKVMLEVELSEKEYQDILKRSLK